MNLSVLRPSWRRRRAPRRLFFFARLPFDDSEVNRFILRFLPAPVTWQYGFLVSESANVAGDFQKLVFRENSLLVKR